MTTVLCESMNNMCDDGDDGDNCEKRRYVEPGERGLKEEAADLHEALLRKKGKWKKMQSGRKQNQ